MADHACSAIRSAGERRIAAFVVLTGDRDTIANLAIGHAATVTIGEVYAGVVLGATARAGRAQ